jgi:hypothetical protein
MNSSSDPSRFESTPERHDAKKLEAGLERVREMADPLLDQLAIDLRLSRDDVMRLAVLLFGQYLDITRSKDTFVLVVKGDVTAYDNALEVLVAANESDEAFSMLLAHLQEVARQEREDSNE